MSALAAAMTASACWFAIFIPGHLFWARVAGDRRYSRVMVRSFAISIVGCVTSLILSHGFFWQGTDLAWGVALGGAVFLMACAFVLYTPFVFVVSSSLSVDTMLMLANATGGALPRHELYEHFASAGAIDRRLQLACGTGMVEAVGQGRYRLTAKACQVALFFSMIKRLWKLWPGG